MSPHIKEDKSTYLLALYFLVTLAYFPVLAYLSSLLFLLFPHANNNKANVFLILSSTTLILSLAITASSYELFTYQESDFTTYYQNYLSFARDGFSTKFFTFGGGLEVGLPLMQYFISKIFLGEEVPYLLVFFHSLCQSFLFFMLLVKLKKYWHLDLKEFSILIASAFLFYKYLGLLNHVRQGYASIFLLMAVYSNSRSSKIILIFIASIFHISSIIIYPLVNFLLKSENLRKKKKFLFVTIIFSLMTFYFIGYLVPILSGKNLILEKLLYTALSISNEDVLLDAIKYAFVRIVYFIPIILACLYARHKSQICNSGMSNIVSIIVFIAAFSFLPSLGSRLIEPVLVLFIGVLYFRFMYGIVPFYRVLLSVITVSFFFKWMVVDARFYSYYEMYSSRPLYYVGYMLTEEVPIDRSYIPKLKDVKFKNRWER